MNPEIGNFDIKHSIHVFPSSHDHNPYISKKILQVFCLIFCGHINNNRKKKEVVEANVRLMDFSDM